MLITFSHFNIFKVYIYHILGKIDLIWSSLDRLMVRVLGIDYCISLFWMWVRIPLPATYLLSGKKCYSPGNMLVIPLVIVNIAWVTILPQYWRGNNVLIAHFFQCGFESHWMRLTHNTNDNDIVRSCVKQFKYGE